MAARLRDLIGTLSTDRARLRAVLAAMADGLLLLDDGERVVLANRAAADLLGLPGEVDQGAASEDGRRLIELVHDHELYELVRQALARRQLLSDMVRLGPSGRYLRITATPMPGGGGSALVLVQDVTEIRRAETIRRDFAANVSHELKTPIASLKALVETLEDGALEDPPAARDFLQRMHVEVDRIAQLVEELLELARIESGRARMTFEPRDAAQMVATAVERLRPQADRAGVTLVVRPGAELPPVRADASRIEGVVVNLVHNAIKFTPAGGRVEAAVDRFELDGRPCVRVAVVDTGAGIPAEDIPRLFERFYKADKSRASSGTGLGLAIVKHVVQAHGGQVGVESEVGVGSTFWFTLPLVAAAAPLQATGGLPASRRRGSAAG
jgi:two-component system phosphate regulon sensor histidine kinase PhoR